MTIGESLPGSEKVRKLQTALHAALHPGLEGAGPCPALPFGNRELCYADDLCVLGEAPAAEMLAAVERLMAGLKLPVNERKTRCLRCPEESFEFLGYRIGRVYRPSGRGSCIGTRPGKSSVQRISRRISDMTAPKHAWQSPEVMVKRLNRTMVGWANYFTSSGSRTGCTRPRPREARRGCS